MRVLIVFLDGVGVGADDPDVNPFARAQLNFFVRDDITRVPLDATLGMPGLPQSGTGQTALLTGTNAAEKFGRHFGPWVPTQLRPLLAEQNILVQARAAGLSVAFANAYPEEIFEQPNDRRLNAGPPLAAIAAGVMNRHTNELHNGQAVASEITNEGWRTHLKRTDLPRITAAQAGRNLAGIAGEHHLTLFAHYSTDYVGHRQDMSEAVQAIEHADEFLEGVMRNLNDDVCTFVVSDHGNIEDVRAGHTLNPALGLTFGLEHQNAAAGLRSITEVSPRVRELLRINIP